jgi:hypothetical protein
VLVPVFTSRGIGIVPIGLVALALLLFTLLAPRLGRSDPAPAEGSAPGSADDSAGGDGVGVGAGTDHPTGQ